MSNLLYLGIGICIGVAVATADKKEKVEEAFEVGACYGAEYAYHRNILPSIAERERARKEYLARE